MTLNIQLQSLIVSFVYGIVLAYILKLQYKYFFYSKLLYKITITALFVFDNTLLYFLLLRIINKGIFHIYFILIMIVGYVFGYYLVKK